jgi:hypothetical protein
MQLIFIDRFILAPPKKNSTIALHPDRFIRFITLKYPLSFDNFLHQNLMSITSISKFCVYPY